MNDNNFFHIDQPIKSPDEDILGRSAFASNLAQSILKLRSDDSFVFGISGEWGSGKSSVLNMVEHYINQSENGQNKSIIFRFNPWWFSGGDQLLPMFFSQLSVAVGRSDSSKRMNKLGKTITTYANALRLFGYLPGLGAMKDSMKAIAKGGKVLTDAAKHYSQDINLLREEIDSHLRNQCRRIIIFMDDLDRMTAKEMTELFQVVKATANFSYTSYILGYDSKILTDSIRSELNVNGHDYLKKIVNIQFDLPCVSPMSLAKTLNSALDNIFGNGKEHSNNEIAQFQSYFHSGILELFKSLRMVKAILNHFRISIAPVENDVFWPDMLALSTLYILVPEVYRTIMNYREKFLGNEYVFDHEEYYKEQAKFHERWLESIDSSMRTQVKNLLDSMFPNARINGHQRNRNPSWRNEHRIACEESFDAYFIHNIPEGKIPGSKWQEFLDHIVDEKYAKRMLIEFSNSKFGDGNESISLISDLLGRAASYALSHEYSSKVTEMLLKICLVHENLIIEARDWMPGGLFSIQNDNAHRLVSFFYCVLRNYCEREDFDQSSQFLSRVIGWDAGLRTVGEFLSNKKLDIKKGHLRGENNEYIIRENFPPIPLAPIQSAIKIFRERFKSLANNEQLEQQPELDKLVSIWIHLDDSNAKKWLEKYIDKKPDLFWLIIKKASLTTLTTGKEVRTYYEYHSESVSFYFKNNVAKSMAKRILKDELFNLSDEEEKLLKTIINEMTKKGDTKKGQQKATTTVNSV